MRVYVKGVTGDVHGTEQPVVIEFEVRSVVTGEKDKPGVAEVTLGVGHTTVKLDGVINVHDRW